MLMRFFILAVVFIGFCATVDKLERIESNLDKIVSKLN